MLAKLVWLRQPVDDTLAAMECVVAAPRARSGLALLVLATPHLSALRGFEAASVEGLLSTLTRFRSLRFQRGTTRPRKSAL